MANNKENQKCWNCKHFQRYDPGEATEGTKCGECHIDPIPGWNGSSNWMDEYAPFITDGNSFWCGKWKKTDLAVPPVPVTGPAVNWPDIWLNWNFWNKREEVNESCWNCDNFQPCDDPPEDHCGECRFDPPRGVVDFIGIDGASDTLEPTELIYDGTEYCCGKWNARKTPFPDPAP